MREMKDSGVEWIGEIPRHWQIIRFRFIAKITTGNQDTQNADPNGAYPFFVRSPIVERCNSYTFDGEGILMAGDGAGAGRVFHLANGKYAVHQRVYRFYDFKYVNPVLLKFYLENLFSLVMDYGSAKTTVPSVRLPMIQNFGVSVPPEEEQHTILEKISEKTEKVDALIQNVQAQIEKLKAYKQSLITEVVTKGLDPTVPMKDSGVEWIGEIAENFQIMRLKNIAYILDQYRKPITADMRSQEGDVLYDYYGASGAIDKIDGYTIDDHVMLIGEDGANLRMRNLPLMYEVKGKAWINNHAHILKPKENVLFYYLFYALEGLDINPYITGSAQPKLSQEKLKIISVPIPAIGVQELVIEYIQDKHRRIDRLIAIKQSKIEKLEQYKKSLIYEYVTGKKEVRL